MPRSTRKNVGQIIRHGNGIIADVGAISRSGSRVHPKDVKYEGRSGNLYENKGPCDNLPDTNGDICARLHAILHKNARIFQKPWAFLRFFECWGCYELA